MFGFAKLIHAQAAEIQDYKKLLKAQDEELANLRKKCSVLLAPRQEIRDSEFAVDWDLIRAFAVERNLDDNGQAITVIGYHLDQTTTIENAVTTTTQVREWYLYCNQTTHDRLVREFREHRGLR